MTAMALTLIAISAYIGGVSYALGTFDAEYFHGG